MEPSHRRARAAEPAADLLTSLPPPLLDAILGGLDIHDAVRTSALSRAWRRRWEALPHLSLCFLDIPRTPPVAVDSVLLRCPGHISRFSFLLHEHSVVRVADWLIALSNRGIKAIDLRCVARDPLPLHSSVFLCTHLVYLELHQCCIPPLPVGFTGFPMLKELRLDSVEFPENGESQLEAILGASPLLHTLNLSYLDIRANDSYSKVWVIRGATLRSLTVINYLYFVWHVGEMPFLDEASIDVGQYVSCSSFSGFLARFSQARKLALFTCYPSFSGDGLVKTLPCTFDNLKSLTLWTQFYEMPAMVLTFCLLRSAPNLEELEIKMHGDGDERREYLPRTQWTDSFCANLQVVKMKDIGWLSNEMYFIELVLSKAIVLRTMHLSLGCKSTKSNEEALCEPMTYRRASPHAQVFLDGKME